MLERSNDSIEIICGINSTEDEDKVVSESVWLSWLLGTLAALTFWKHACRGLNNFKYYDILNNFNFKAFTWLTNSLWATLSPAISVSYSAWLLEAWKPNLSDFSNMNPSGDIITISIPILDPFTLDAPSTNTHYGWIETCHTPSVTPSAGVNSATKSANTRPLIEILSLYCISNVPSLIPHFTISQ